MRFAHGAQEQVFPGSIPGRQRFFLFFFCIYLTFFFLTDNALSSLTINDTDTNTRISAKRVQLFNVAALRPRTSVEYMAAFHVLRCCLINSRKISRHSIEIDEKQHQS